jgi:shikimate dehydrogenase
MHNAALRELGLDWVYVPFTVAPEHIAEAVRGVRALGIRGVNVTVPLKERIAPHLDFLTPAAEAIGAVNTLFWDGGRLGGDSTDGAGFLAALASAGVSVTTETNAVVLGAGGSARAIVYALTTAGARVTLTNRTPEKAAALAERFPHVTLAPWDDIRLAGAHLLVNTTSVGMHPNTDAIPPIPADALHPDLFVSDLIYNPAETRLLALARARGCRTQNGMEMLVQQGALSFTRWTGREPSRETMRTAVTNYLLSRQ